MSELRKYGVLLTTAKAIQFTLYQVDGVDIEPAATFAIGDIKISKDGAAEVDAANLPTDEGQGYRLILTAAELTASRIRLFIVDQTATKVWLDVEINIETHGHASAMFITDFDEVMRGTDSAATATALATAQTDLDTITGADGATLATAQGLYAPSKAGDAMALTAAATSAQLVDDIWEELTTGHTTNNTYGKILKGIAEGWISDEGSVNDAGATTTSFISDLVQATDNFFDDTTVVFTTGVLKGQSRIVSGYNGTTKAFTFDEAFTSAPANTVQFIILAQHTHTHKDIAEGVRAEMDANSTQLAAIVADTGTTIPALLGTPSVDIAADIAVINTAVDGIQTDLSNGTDGLGALKVLIDDVKVDTASGGIPKNAIFNDFQFPMVLTSDHYTAATAKTVTGQRSLDGGVWTNVTGTISEVGSGLYTIDLTAADTNGDTISYKFSATDCDDTITPTIITRS